MGLQLAISLTDEAREVLSGLSMSEQRQYSCLVDALTGRFSPAGRVTIFPGINESGV